MYKFILIAFLIWRFSLILISRIGEVFIPQRLGFLGPSVWANFDGVHYLSIAQNGYMRYQEAFFPLYPLLINFFGKTIFLGNYLWAALFISHTAFLIALLVFYKLVRLDFNDTVAKISLLGILIFPTSFFFGAVYTESLFMLLTLASFYAARKEKWFWAGVLGGLAAITKLVGIFLLPALLWVWWKKRGNSISLFWLGLIPLGLLSYILYLGSFVGDGLAFIHAQPAFGAGRTGGEIILFPQVYWRYFKIFATVPLANYDFWIAVAEFFIFNLALISLWFAWRKKVDLSYLIFSFLALVGPTLTGTFSSIPRYALVLFPIFIYYGLIKTQAIRVSLLVAGFLLLFLLAVFFTRGFFVA